VVRPSKYPQFTAPSVYDASYVALADRLGVPLLTADERLINCLAGSPYRLQTITEFYAAIT